MKYKFSFHILTITWQLLDSLNIGFVVQVFKSNPHK